MSAHTPSNAELLIESYCQLAFAKAALDTKKQFAQSDIIEIRANVTKANCALLELERRLAGVKPPTVGDEPIQQQADRP